MIAPQLSAYNFAAPEHWRRCLLHRFEASAAETLSQNARLGSRAKHIEKTSYASAIGLYRSHAVIWREHTPGPGGSSVVARWLDDYDNPSAPIEVDTSLAHSTRWIVDREWLWAFDHKPPRVHRYDRETLQRDLTIDLGNMGSDVDAAVLEVLDIASDVRGGLWLLVQSQQQSTRLVRLDCDGCLREQFDTPCAAGPVTQLATVDAGETLVLLAADGKRLWFVATANGAERYSRALANLTNCWTAERVATDTKNRIALGVRQHGEWALLLLSAAGDVLEGPLAKLFVRPKRCEQSDTTPEHAPARDEAPPWRVDLAVSGDKVWIARRDGLWFIDSSAVCEPGESESVLLTPALFSPQVDTSRGWLRAELVMHLPRGAVLSAEYASTNDEHVAARLTGIAESSAMSARSKLESIWAELDTSRRSAFTETGTADDATAVAIPLFESEDRWIWVRLTLVTPPGAAATSISTLRVLYPNLSLVEQLPAVFRGPDGDVAHILRRLVGTLEATTQGIDETIRGIAANLNPDTAPNDWLDYVARWLALPWDDALPEAAKRCILGKAAELLTWRGTRRGLTTLVRCLVGKGPRVELTDLTVDHAAMRLGGDRCVGAPLPALLAGVPRWNATIGAKAVLGRARIASTSDRCDPLASIAPTVSVSIATPRALSDDMKAVFKDLIDQYLPVGVKLSLRWHVRPDIPDADGEDASDVFTVLDAERPGTLGTDSVIGRTVLTGRTTAMIDEAGLELGFHL